MTRRDVIEFILLVLLLACALAFIAWNRNSYRENFIEEFDQKDLPVQTPVP